MYSSKTMPPFTELELFSQGLKGMKVNFNSSLGRTNTRFEHHETTRVSLETRVRNRFHLQLEDVLQKEWYKIPLDCSKFV
jgi:hypothetical protein